ncbi:MAG: glycine zipper 2TM domain-containing protein [Methylococcales bacterium]|nr:glycine zipper 2TM domain-containing protein [Methylococcaceae bacterium]
MKNWLLLLQIAALAGFYSSNVHADGHGRGHHKHRHHEEAGYYPQQAPGYYPQPPRPADPRSHQGLAGGVVGSVLGYEIGNGDPIATGLGAAAGSFLGNNIAGRR